MTGSTLQKKSETKCAVDIRVILDQDGVGAAAGVSVIKIPIGMLLA